MAEAADIVGWQSSKTEHILKGQNYYHTDFNLYVKSDIFRKKNKAYGCNFFFFFLWGIPPLGSGAPLLYVEYRR